MTRCLQPETLTKGRFYYFAAIPSCYSTWDTHANVLKKSFGTVRSEVPSAWLLKIFYALCNGQGIHACILDVHF